MKNYSAKTLTIILIMIALLSGLTIIAYGASNLKFHGEVINLKEISPGQYKNIEKKIKYKTLGGKTDRPAVRRQPTNASASTNLIRVSIDVKKGDYVLVTIGGAAHAYMYGAIVLTGGNAQLVLRQPFYMNWTPTEDIVWANFVMRSIYLANADGTLSFGPEYWFGNFTQTRDVWVLSYFAQAEIIKSLGSSSILPTTPSEPPVPTPVIPKPPTPTPSTPGGKVKVSPPPRPIPFG